MALLAALGLPTCDADRCRGDDGIVVLANRDDDDRDGRPDADDDRVNGPADERDLVTLEPDGPEDAASTSSPLLSASAATLLLTSLLSFGLYPQKKRSSNHANRPARTTDWKNESTRAGRLPSMAAWPTPTCTAQEARWASPADLAGEERRSPNPFPPPLPLPLPLPAQAVAASHIGRARTAVQLNPAKRSRKE